MKNHYKGKSVLITGGSEGIGKAMAIDLVSLGAHVTILARNPLKLEHALAEMKTRKISDSQKLEALPCDVTDFENTKKVIEDLIAEDGVPDILMNVAGSAMPGYIQEQDLKSYHDMMDLNYFGLVHTCKILIPHFIKRKSGAILNTSSMCGFLGLFGYTGYCASKFAVTGFSEALRREMRPYGIQVSLLCPPNTSTPGLERENQSKPKEVLAAEEKAKTATPEHVSAITLSEFARKKFMIIPTFDGSMAYYLNRVSPSIIDQFVKRKDIQV